MNVLNFKNDFLYELRNPLGLSQIFNFLPNVCFWIKNSEGQFVVLNQACVEKLGGFREEDIIGKTDYDVSPDELAARFVADDQSIIKSKRTIHNHTEFNSNASGYVQLYSTNKIPIYSNSNNVIGVAGTTWVINSTNKSALIQEDLWPAVDFIHNEYKNKISIEELCKVTDLSASQLNRRFKKHIGVTPIHYIIKIRLQSACEQLRTTQNKLSWIAVSNGFYDYSMFHRKFVETLGITPTDYRKKYYVGS